MGSCPPKFVMLNLGVSSFKEDDGRSEVYSAEEDEGAFVVSGGDGAEGLELGEEVFDEVPCGVEVFVVFAPVCAVDLGGDYDLDATGIQDIDDPFLSVISAVGEQCAEAADNLGKQSIGAMEVVKMALCQVEGDGIAERIA